MSNTRFLVTAALIGLSWSTLNAHPLRILPLGDSITRGSYTARYSSGPYIGEAIGIANPQGGGWRKLLQDQLRENGVEFDFLGELNYHSFGSNGLIDEGFDPHHHGLAGFGNKDIIAGGLVPTPRDVLNKLGVKNIRASNIIEVLKNSKPEIVLLMSGSNGFDSAARDKLIELIHAHSEAHLFVASITPQIPPRIGWEKVDEYNASLPNIVAKQQARGHKVTLVNMSKALNEQDLLPDGVHPNAAGMGEMSETWYTALQTAGFLK
jgi:lysophospholipase L1-like esterase